MADAMSEGDRVLKSNLLGSVQQVTENRKLYKEMAQEICIGIHYFSISKSIVPYVLNSKSLRKNHLLFC